MIHYVSLMKMKSKCFVMTTYFHYNHHRRIQDCIDNVLINTVRCPNIHSDNSVSYQQQQMHKKWLLAHHHHRCTMKQTNVLVPYIWSLLDLQMVAGGGHWICRKSKIEQNEQKKKNFSCKQTYMCRWSSRSRIKTTQNLFEMILGMCGQCISSSIYTNRCSPRDIIVKFHISRFRLIELYVPVAVGWYLLWQFLLTQCDLLKCCSIWWKRTCRECSSSCVLYV